MQRFPLLAGALGLALAAFLAPAPAAAADLGHPGHHGYGSHDGWSRGGRHHDDWDRPDRRYGHRDRGYGYGHHHRHDSGHRPDHHHGHRYW